MRVGGAAAAGVQDRNYTVVGRTPVLTVQRDDLQPPERGWAVVPPEAPPAAAVRELQRPKGRLLRRLATDRLLRLQGDRLGSLRRSGANPGGGGSRADMIRPWRARLFAEIMAIGADQFSQQSE